MLVTKKLTVDLARKTILGSVDAVRGDSAIALEMTMLCDGAPWTVPANASVVVRYGQGEACGTYDTLSDGTPAWSIQGNVLTVRVAPEVCSAAGKTDFQVTILEKGSQISTFRMVVDVQGVVSGSDKPGKYTSLAQWLLANGKDGQVVVNLELEDLRVGTDGTQYETAGEAVRGQLEAMDAKKVDNTAFSALQNRVEEVANTPCACEEQVIDLTGKIVQNYYLPWTGTPEYKRGERCTDFIPVHPGWPIELANIRINGSRSICVYDENQTFLRVLKYGGEDAAITLTIKMPMDAAYMRCSVDPVKTPHFRYVDPLGIRLQLVDDRITSRIDGLETRVNSQLDGLSPYARTIDLTGKIIKDYYLPWTGTAEKKSGERCMDFIPVKGGYSIHFENAKLEGSRSVCVYDADKKFLRCLRYGSEETAFVLKMPENAAYMRCSVHDTLAPVIHYESIVDSAVSLLEQKLSARIETLTGVDLEDYPTKAQMQTAIENAIAAIPVYNGEVEDV